MGNNDKLIVKQYTSKKGGIGVSISKIQGVLLSLLINSNILIVLGFPAGVTAFVNSVSIITIHFSTQRIKKSK